MGKIVFGTAALQLWDVDTIKEIFSYLKTQGVNDLDAAYAYGTEGLIGEAGGGETLKIHTKAPGWVKGCLAKEKIRATLEESLEKLKVTSVETFFLHTPDPETPIEETLGAVHELYKEGKFKYFGLSNFNAKELQEHYDVCSSNGFILPTVFQSNYNPVARHVEDEIIPLVRKLGMSFFAYSPLAGGFLTKSSEQFKAPLEGRWSMSAAYGPLYNMLYNKPEMVKVLDKWAEAAEKAKCTKAALASRWVLHHSALRGDQEDALLIGATSVEQLKQTIDYLKDGPLPADVLGLIDEIWASVKDVAPLDNYHG